MHSDIASLRPASATGLSGRPARLGARAAETPGSGASGGTRRRGSWKCNQGYASAEEALKELTGRSGGSHRRGGGEKVRRPSTVLPASASGLTATRCAPSRAPNFPDEFLPIISYTHLEHFMNVLGLQPKGDLLARNRQLLTYLRSQSESQEMDTQQMSVFLYDAYSPWEKPGNGNGGGEPAQPLPQVLDQLLLLTQGDQPATRNIILYGPPGTGKTWITNHFANYFLLRHNVSHDKATAYWQAVEDDDLKGQRLLREEVREVMRRAQPISQTSG